MADHAHDKKALELRTPNRAVAAAAAVAAVPWAGGPMSTLLMERWNRMAQENIAEFVTGIEEDLEELAFDVATLEDRLDHDYVSEVFSVAGRTAQFSSHAATRRRCRNAVVNAIRQPQRAAMNLRFIRLIDDLTPAHFSLLKLLDDPTADEAYVAAIQGRMGSMLGPIAAVLEYSEDFVEMLAGDLQSEGLADMPGRAMMTGQGLQAQRTTERGRQLLEFVSRPVAGDR